MRRLVPCLFLLGLAGCGSDNGSESGSGSGDKLPTALADQALADYKRVVRASYADVLQTATSLRSAVDAFAAAPSEATQNAAKQAWIASRVPYSQSEAFRYYDGPIDDPMTGPEPLINGWPLDELYIDYTRDTPQSGIINELTDYPQLTKELLERANEARGEKALSTGYHAIEFLLWGQDDPTPGTGPGKRSFKDYLPQDQGGTAANAERRRTYLTLAAELLVDNLRSVTDAWAEGNPSNFAASFGVKPDEVGGDARKEAVSKVLRAIGTFAKAELSGERMSVAFESRSQEDEHDCFSDITSSDLLGGALGIQNVWLGRYRDFDGVGFDALVAAVDPSVANQMTSDIATAVTKLGALVALQDAGKPLDVVIQAADGSPERTAMVEAIQALKQVGTDVERVATTLGLSVQIPEPSEL